MRSSQVSLLVGGYEAWSSRRRDHLPRTEVGAGGKEGSKGVACVDEALLRIRNSSFASIAWASLLRVAFGRALARDPGTTSEISPRARPASCKCREQVACIGSARSNGFSALPRNVSAHGPQPTPMWPQNTRLSCALQVPWFPSRVGVSLGFDAVSRKAPPHGPQSEGILAQAANTVVSSPEQVASGPPSRFLFEQVARGSPRHS